LYEEVVGKVFHVETTPSPLKGKDGVKPHVVRVELVKQRTWISGRAELAAVVGNVSVVWTKEIGNNVLPYRRWIKCLQKPCITEDLKELTYHTKWLGGGGGAG